MSMGIGIVAKTNQLLMLSPSPRACLMTGESAKKKTMVYRGIVEIGATQTAMPPLR